MLTLSSALLINVSFANLDSVNLLPNFIFTILFTVAIYKLASRSDATVKYKKSIISVGAVYTAVSVAAYVISFKFLTEFGYDMLYEGTRPEAVALYKAYEIISLVSFALHVAISLIFFFLMKNYLNTELGTPKGSESYRPSDAAYHGYLNGKTLIYTVMLLLVGLLELAAIISSGSVELIFTNPNDVTKPTMIVSSLPWIPTVNLIFNVIFVFYSIYYFNFIKEEMKV